MAMYEVDDELAFQVDRLARRNKPFESLSFQEGLRRVLDQYVSKTMPELARQVVVERAITTAQTVLRKAPTPSAIQWAQVVPELKKFKHFTTWKTITDHLDIDTAGDSARRKLKNWVKANKPDWPPVPDID